MQGELLGSLQLPLVLHSAVWEQRAHPHPVLHCIMESGMHNKSRAVALFEASGLDLHTLCSERGKKQTCRTLCSSHSPVLQVQAPRTAKSLKARQLPTPMLFLCLHIRALDCATEASSLFSADSTQCHLTYLSLRQSDIQEPWGETAKQFCHPQRGQGSLHIGWGCQQGQQCRG